MPQNKAAPSHRWTREHGKKIQHRFWLAAWWHARDLNRRFDMPRYWHVYRCRWGQWYRDGEIGKPHWHVGRPPVR